MSVTRSRNAEVAEVAEVVDPVDTDAKVAEAAEAVGVGVVAEAGVFRSEVSAFAVPDLSWQGPTHRRQHR